jgi:hypothetical protein
MRLMTDRRYAGWPLELATRAAAAAVALGRIVLVGDAGQAQRLRHDRNALSVEPAAVRRPIVVSCPVHRSLPAQSSVRKLRSARGAFLALWFACSGCTIRYHCDRNNRESVPYVHWIFEQRTPGNAGNLDPVDAV